MATFLRFLLLWIMLSVPIDRVNGQSAPKAERLLSEKSPYLQRHADNVVDWYPWGDAAFARARELNRPVFLNIGYSTSPSCSAIEQESFMTGEIADLLNRNFVSVLVDREERPALDNACVRYLLLVNEPPSWPVHIFLTPERLPMYGTGYLPNEGAGRQDGQTLKSALNHVLASWRRDTGGYLSKQTARDAKRMQETINAQPETEGTNTLARDNLELFVRQVISNSDSVYGGSLSVPKFPLAPTLQWLHQFSQQFGSTSTGQQAGKLVEITLQKMATGGIRDHVGGGFHRYAQDEQWSVPSFEKALYDQALLGETYAQLYATTENPFYKEIAAETFRYMVTQLNNVDGGFFTSEDAGSLPDVDASQPAPGAFYCWTEQQFDTALSMDADARILLKRHFGIRPGGNTPPGSDPGQKLAGKNVLFEKLALDEAANEAGIPATKASEVYERGLSLLRKYQSTRPRPMVDRKILVSWNGYAIAALARGATALKQPQLLEQATTAIDFLFQNMIDHKSTAIRRSWLGSSASDIDGTCDDYASMVDASLALYTATGNKKWLSTAQVFQQKQIDDFLDPATGAFFEISHSRSDIFLRLRPAFDSDILSCNALAARNLVRLSRAADEPQRSHWIATAEKLFTYFEPMMCTQSPMTPGLFSAWEEFTRP